MVDGAVIMRVNSEDQATGRGRDSVRISSKDEWADVRILPSHFLVPYSDPEDLWIELTWL